MNRTVPSPPFPSNTIVPECVLDAYKAYGELGQGAVAAGYLLRHGLPANLEACLEGYDLRATLREWWEGLTEQEREHVRVDTLRQATFLAAMVEDREADADPEDRGWQRDVEGLATARDALCSALRVLQTFDPDNVPKDALSSLDKALRRLWFSLYQEIEVSDPLLVLGADQGLWWATPGKPLAKG